MLTMREVAERQRGFVAERVRAARSFADGLPKSGLAAILLSGSVARGDYFPGKLGGNIDVTVFSRRGSGLGAEELFGPDEDPDIPYHCVSRGGEGFQIAFGELFDGQAFLARDEAAKFALGESRLLWEDAGAFTAAMAALSPALAAERASLRAARLGEIRYLLSEYKQDRWIRREAALQLHANLDAAIEAAIPCLFYANDSYAPAKDRRLYYACELPRLPPDFERLLAGLLERRPDSLADYRRREELISRRLLAFVTEA
ncbi:MAG: hypothetical protein JNG85_12465 [Spirochaetaceae bacterium]|nr:hypothetical protein [Spirochaetaceae bacterium]